MKIVFILSFTIIQLAYAKSTALQKSVPFSSQFIEDGALIRNINYDAVKALIPKIEKKFGVKLKNRGEAHITVITPPEAQGWFTDKKGINFHISPIEMHKKYFSSLQSTKFKAKCIGRQKNTKGHDVFYIVVESEDLMDIRKEIQKEVEARGKFSKKKVYFKAENYYPHITIGYVGGDVHGVSKGSETCVLDL
jgi:2'-5' RNA ligase